MENKSMLIVADENMPLVEECFSGLGDIRRLPGRTLRPEDVKNAEVLLVRSVTQVNEDLLKGSKVRFVATATIGTDHLDIPFLEKSEIAWSSAAGCNALSVAEYVVSCVARLRMDGILSKSGGRAAVIGVGNVGSLVSERLKWLGFDVLEYDPPRAERDADFKTADFDDLRELDLLCLHTPLTKDGRHPTFHMVGGDFLNRQREGCVLLSAGRGPVVDFSALPSVTDRLRLVLDVWEPEPGVLHEDLKRACIASPHVAGYSLQSKWRGTRMVRQAASDKLANLPAPPVVPDPVETPKIILPKTVSSWEELVLSLYDPMRDTEQMKSELLSVLPDEVGPRFDKLRKNYPLRHEFAFPVIEAQGIPEGDRQLLLRLGFRFL